LQKLSRELVNETGEDCEECESGCQSARVPLPHRGIMRCNSSFETAVRTDLMRATVARCCARAASGHAAAAPPMSVMNARRFIR
jgi:hypothetical protein